ncbi:hypothetical protein BJV74DRAFT_184515 [Russula compacta]|nr:hypothetical protein BJV74DRAFT_184515 [Russula compacta]
MLTVKGSNAVKRDKELWVEDDRVTIETLPDDALLEVFDFYVHDIFDREEWITLTHVCRRWRYIVFASPIRLNLILYCKPIQPVREMLDTWPPFPIVVEDTAHSEEDADKIIAALEHNDRVCGIDIYITQVSSSVLGRFARAMQEPFPQLTDLVLSSYETTLVLPETFLGGSAPRLRSCYLDYLPFPALRSLLLSASHLVVLCLDKIPHSAYTSPEAMVTCLAVATSLKFLELIFLSPQSRSNHEARHLPPLIRTILPALTHFNFHGDSEYLEDFISRVDAPLLDEVDIRLFHQLTFDLSQLDQFISRTEALSALNIVNLDLDCDHTRVELSQLEQTLEDSRPMFRLSVRCNGSHWQLSFLAQAFSSLSPTLSTFETINVRENRFQPVTPSWEDDVGNSQWLELFHPFTSVKNLYLSEDVAPLVAPALQQLAEERVTEVLPALQNIYVEGLQPSGPIQEDIGLFVAARQLLNQTVAVVYWDGPE